MQQQTTFLEELPASLSRLLDEGGVVLGIIAGASVIAWILLIAKWLGLRAEDAAIEEGSKLARGDRRQIASLWMSAERGRLRQGLGPIEVLAALLPLLGLLGTVLGMLKTFEVIQAQGTGDPRLMADGIRQALVTTQAGILAVLPVLLLHRFLASRAERAANAVQVRVQRAFLQHRAEREGGD